MFLAENIKYLREQEGMTQEELARKMELSRSGISLWETGTREPELSKLIKLTELFKVTLDELVLQELKPPIPLYVKNIKYLRKKNEMSQEDMSNLLGYKGKQGYNAIETGKAKATIDNLEKLADFFGVTLDQLVKKDLSKGDTGNGEIK